MIWHQIFGNGIQSTVLPLISMVLTLLLSEEAITGPAAKASMALVRGGSPQKCVGSAAFLSGVHFICNLKAVTVGTVLFVPISEHLGHSFKFQIYV